MNKLDRKAICPKCGKAEWWLEHKPATAIHGEQTYILPEVIKKTCGDCKYTVWDLPLDAKEPAT